MRTYESRTATLRALLAHPSLQRDVVERTFDALADANADARELDEAVSASPGDDSTHNVCYSLFDIVETPECCPVTTDSYLNWHPTLLYYLYAHLFPKDKEVGNRATESRARLGVIAFRDRLESLLGYNGE